MDDLDGFKGEDCFTSIAKIKVTLKKVSASANDAIQSAAAFRVG